MRSDLAFPSVHCGGHSSLSNRAIQVILARLENGAVAHSAHFESCDHRQCEDLLTYQALNSSKQSNKYPNASFQRRLWFLKQCKQKLYNCKMCVIMSVKIKMNDYLILNRYSRDISICIHPHEEVMDTKHCF